MVQGMFVGMASERGGIKMQKIERFHSNYMRKIRDEIAEYSETNKMNVTTISLTATSHGFVDFYEALVVFEKEVE